MTLRAGRDRPPLAQTSSRIGNERRHHEQRRTSPTFWVFVRRSQSCEVFRMETAKRPPVSAFSQTRNGGRHCCQPPLRRAKDLPVFVTWLACAPPSFDPSSPAQASLPVMFQSEDRNSTFHGPSWIDPLFALSAPRRGWQLRQKDQLFRRLLPAGPVNFRWAYVPKDFSVSSASPSPAGGDRCFGSWSLRCRSGHGRCPDHHVNMTLIASRSKRNR